VSALEIIAEIQRLPPAEQEHVVRLASALTEDRELSGDEIDGLVARLLETSDPIEKALLRESIVRGFYGGPPDA
jgi:hypothetical protein